MSIVYLLFQYMKVQYLVILFSFFHGPFVYLLNSSHLSASIPVLVHPPNNCQSDLSKAKLWMSSQCLQGTAQTAQHGMLILLRLALDSCFRLVFSLSEDGTSGNGRSWSRLGASRWWEFWIVSLEAWERVNYGWINRLLEARKPTREC